MFEKPELSDVLMEGALAIQGLPLEFNGSITVREYGVLIEIQYAAALGTTIARRVTLSWAETASEKYSVVKVIRILCNDLKEMQEQLS